MRETHVAPRAIPLADAKGELLRAPQFREAYDALEEEYELRRQLIALRLARGLTQEELAECVGTKQSGISRLESGSHRPSLAMLEKVAAALGAKVEIKLTPLEDHEPAVK